MYAHNVAFCNSILMMSINAKEGDLLMFLSAKVFKLFGGE